eukprot:scaffold13394_cov79-Phaeocystis_antarctica.AAC.5
MRYEGQGWGEGEGEGQGRCGVPRACGVAPQRRASRARSSASPSGVLRPSAVAAPWPPRAGTPPDRGPLGSTQSRQRACRRVQASHRVAAVAALRQPRLWAAAESAVGARMQHSTRSPRRANHGASAVCEAPAPSRCAQTRGSWQSGCGTPKGAGVPGRGGNRLLGGRRTGSPLPHPPLPRAAKLARPCPKVPKLVRVTA